MKFTRNAKVYELHGTTWHLIYEMTKNTPRDDHQLWKGAAPTTPQTVSEDEVAKAIASITGTTT